MNNKLKQAAKQAAQKAYVPYSGYKLGAAVLTKSDKIYTGCNIENSSYGLTNCAERTAIFKAVSEGETEFVEMVIYSDTKNLFYPCGACRQVISEFSSDMKISIISEKDELESDINELLPHSFNLNK
ncbi:MAG: cytidine deaminase [Candidatus Cloacimonetes bacterium]|nr:cytidine deaminase [Candidatus Cloacimonadota bacterium]